MSKLSWINAKPWKPWCHNDPHTFRYAAGAPCSSNNLTRLKLSGSSCWKTSAAKPGKHAWHTKLLSANIPPTQSHTQEMRVTSCSFWKICCRSRTWNNIKISKSNNHTHRVAIISNAQQKSNRVFLNSLLKKRECKSNFPPMGHSKVVIFRKLPTLTEPPLPVLWFALAGGFIATNRGQTHETRVYWCWEPLFKDRSHSKFFTCM